MFAQSFFVSDRTNQQLNTNFSKQPHGELLWHGNCGFPCFCRYEKIKVLGPAKTPVNPWGFHEGYVKRVPSGMLMPTVISHCEPGLRDAPINVHMD